MCGRFTQHLSWAELHRLADLIGQPRNLAPRYNIAPTTQIEVIRRHDGGIELTPMRWGLVPMWWKKPLNSFPPRSMRAPRRLGRRRYCRTTSTEHFAWCTMAPALEPMRNRSIPGR